MLDTQIEFAYIVVIQTKRICKMYMISFLSFMSCLAIWLVLDRPIIWYKALFIALLLAVLCYGMSYSTKQFYIYGSTSDTELLHGSVSGKTRLQKNCNIGWSDFSDTFCTNEIVRQVVDYVSYEGTGKNRHMVTHYKTQYKSIYPYEVKWYVLTTLGKYYTV